MPLLIPIGLDPVAFSLGGIEIRWYGIFVALSLLTALLIARAGARRAGLATALVDDAALWVGLSALVGVRLLYLVAGVTWLLTLRRRGVPTAVAIPGPA